MSEDAKRPDKITLIPWEDCRPLLWDFTFCNTLAQSHCARAERGPGVVANFAEDQKCRKYTSLTRIFGGMGDNAKVFIHKIGQRVKENSGEPRSTSFLIQRLALDVQKGNATSVLGTIPASRDWSEVGFSLLRLFISFFFCVFLMLTTRFSVCTYNNFIDKVSQEAY